MQKVAKVLVIVGALNWGLIGLGGLIGGQNWNVVHMIFGTIPTLEGIVYVLVGVAAIKLFFCKCKTCGVHKQTGNGPKSM